MTVRPFKLTNPMMRKGPIREFLPLPAKEAAVRLPPGKRPRVQVAKGDCGCVFLRFWITSGGRGMVRGQDRPSPFWAKCPKLVWKYLKIQGVIVWQKLFGQNAKNGRSAGPKMVRT